MPIRHRIICLLLGLGLTGTARPAAGQVPASADSLKGRIWTATARRIWADVKLKQPKPENWATTADFTQWMSKQRDDKSELGLLWKAVLERVGKGQPGTPAQVRQAIEAEIAQRRQDNVGRLVRVKLPLLQADLAQLVPTAAPTTTSKPPAPTSSAVAEDANPAPDEPEEFMSAAGATPTIRPLSYFGLPPYWAGAALALLGALVGAGLHVAWRKSRRRARYSRYSRYAPTLTAEPDTSLAMHTQESRRLKQENQKLQGRIHHLEREMAELRAQLTGRPAAAPVATAPEVVEVAAAPADDDLLSVAALPGAALPAEAEALAQVPPATRYGPAQETPFVEERKIVDHPLPQLALMLTVHPHTPDRASFTLNPHVNQSMLIGDGLNRLQKFFDYDPPVGRISAVTAAAAGQLQRQAGGWQVVERARLTIR